MTSSIRAFMIVIVVLSVALGSFTARAQRSGPEVEYAAAQGGAALLTLRQGRQHALPLGSARHRAGRWPSRRRSSSRNTADTRKHPQRPREGRLVYEPRGQVQRLHGRHEPMAGNE